MEHPPPLQQEAAVSHLVRQGMREGVDRVREEPRLIEHLRVLEVRQTTMQGVLRQSGDPLQQPPGHLGANDGRVLHQAFGLRGEAVEAGRQHRVHRRRYRRGSLIVFHRMPRQLLHKKGIAGPVRHNLLTPGRRELGGARHGHHNGLALFRPQRRQRQLGHPRVRAPGRLIPRPCRHQQQHGGARQPLDQRPQPGFGRGIDPVHVLHGEHQRPLLRLLADQMPQERKRPGLAESRDSTAPGARAPPAGPGAGPSGPRPPLR